jgi:hypothetical protein
MPPDRAGVIIRHLRDCNGDAGKMANVRKTYKTTYESLDQAGRERVQSVMKELGCA